MGVLNSYMDENDIHHPTIHLDGGRQTSLFMETFPWTEFEELFGIKTPEADYTMEPYIFEDQFNRNQENFKAEDWKKFLQTPAQEIFNPKNELRYIAVHLLNHTQCLCDAADMAWIYFLPYRCVPLKAEIIAFLNNKTLEQVYNAPRIMTTTCPICKPSAYPTIVGNSLYADFSLNGTNICRCVACGG